MGHLLDTKLAILDNVKFLNRSSYLIGILAVLILLFSGIDYAVQRRFHIQHIVIEGDIKHVTKEQLSYIAKNRLKGTLFTLNISSLQQEFRQIPWVKEVTVSREFPDTIIVDISEFNALARFGEEGLISEEGKIFEGADSNIDLPTFYVSVNQIPDALKDYKILSELLKNHSISLSKLFLARTGIMRFELSNNLTITICGNDIENQVDLISQYWDRLYQLNPKLNSINLCYKNAMAINGVLAVSNNPQKEKQK